MFYDHGMPVVNEDDICATMDIREQRLLAIIEPFITYLHVKGAYSVRFKLRTNAPFDHAVHSLLIDRYDVLLDGSKTGHLTATYDIYGNPVVVDFRGRIPVKRRRGDLECALIHMRSSPFNSKLPEQHNGLRCAIPFISKQLLIDALEPVKEPA